MVQPGLPSLTALPSRRAPGRCVPALVLLLLGACASDTNPVRDVFVAVGAGPKESTAPDFVAQSRQGRNDYMPVGVNAPTRALPAKTGAQIKQSEAELDALRAGNATRADEAQKAAAPTR